MQARFPLQAGANVAGHRQRQMPHPARLSALTLALSQACLAVAAPSQLPLFYRADALPRANVMLTLDDSGSMTYQYLPERPFTLNGQTVSFPTDAKVFLNPMELPRNRFTYDGGWADTFYVTAAPTSSLSTDKLRIQMQMRSPQVNGIYYNPDVRYTPWIASDGTPYANADVTHAWLDPAYLKPGTTPPDPTTNSEWVDLTKTITASVRWYCSTTVGAPGYVNSDCGEKTLSFNPGLLYLLTPGADPNQTSSYTAIDLNAISADTKDANVSHSSKRTDCNVSGNSVTCTKDQELQNFANWFVYYRSRLLTAQGAIPEAFMSMSDNLRIGWGTIHQGITFTNGVPSDTLDLKSQYYPDGIVSGTSYPSPIVQQSVRILSDTHKTKLTDWMRSLRTYGGTPSKDALYEVGQYFSRSDRYGPWATAPSLGLPEDPTKQLGCRRNYNILVTDGYYLASTRTMANVDDTAVTRPANKPQAPVYTPSAPFQDDNANTLADFAMKFWVTDLRSDLASNGDITPITVTPTAPTDPKQTKLAEIKSDPATWRHLSQFMIGFGVSGDIVTRDEATNDDLLWQLSNCKSTKKCWPTSVNEIDDLWHAAINSRGRYFTVSQGDQLKSALVSALTTTTAPIAKVGGVATASKQLIAGNIKYVPEYQPGAWSGNVRAKMLDAYGSVTTEVWDAANRMPTPTDRNIYVWDTQSQSASPFTYTGMSSRSKGLLGTLASDSLVNFLRGANNAAWTQFRTRAPAALDNSVAGAPSRAVLPDFVNSPPLFVQRSDGLDYGRLETDQSGTKYSQYLTDKNTRTTGTLFVGSNGGMLHAFNTGDPLSTSPTQGREVFAFVPETGLANLANTASRNYGSIANYHQYFVDGPLAESDAYFKARGQNAAQWNNVVVGTMGAGGRAVFALSLNRLDSNALDGTNIQWESTGIAYPDMGYITSTPQVGVLPNGHWYVFVGNGVDSTNGTAALLMIDIETGVVQAVQTDTSITGNGLGGVTLVLDGQKQVIGAYAGDVKGNLWRFEWNGSAVTTGYSASPLFKAGSTQPITAAPMVVKHPDFGSVVVFNTGRLLYADDSSDTSKQSVYGIWDKNPIAVNAPTTAFTPPVITSANLQTQTISNPRDVQRTTTANGITTTQTRTYYAVSANEVYWQGHRDSTGNMTTQPQSGWKLDLEFADSAATGAALDYPKAIYTPGKVAGALALINTVKPASSEESCNGENKGKGFSIILDPVTGGKSPYMTLDTNGDHQFTSTDLADTAAFSSEAGGETIIEKNVTITVPATGVPGLGQTPGSGTDTTTTATDTSIQSTDSDQTLRTTCEVTKSCGSGTSPAVKRRVWRQLLNPPSP
jgi:type IV pilus assembly protein PilY1